MSSRPLTPPTELLIQALALGALVVSELPHTCCDHRYASMGIQMLGDTKCLNSSCGRALCLQEWLVLHDAWSSGALLSFSGTQSHTKQGEVNGLEVVELGKVTEGKVLLMGCLQSDGFIQPSQ
jgi:hypothetical protein